MSFVFYDTETTGLSTRFDQIVHFAAIKTDHDLREVERFEVRSRLQAHVLPHPEALCVSGLGIGQLLDPRLPSHYAMVCAIHAKLSGWSPSVFAGYNSIRFDEELLRQAFFQTLHPIYLTSQPRSGRADVLSLVNAALASAPDSLVVPRQATGRPSFKLADIARANGVAHTRAHHAMSDVEAVVALCRRLKTSAPDAWQSFTRFSNKSAVADFVASEDAFVLTEFYGGEAYAVPVVLLGPQTNLPTGRLCLVLNAQTHRIMAASDAELEPLLLAKPSPVRRLRTNGAPVLTPMYDVEDDAFGLSVDEIEDLARQIRADPVLCARLIRVYESRLPAWPVSPYPEGRMYEAFPSEADLRVMERFHRVDWPERARLLDQIDDERFRALGERLVHGEAPHALTAAQTQRVTSALGERMVPSADGPVSRETALGLISGMWGGASANEQRLLAEYRDYLA